LGQVWRERAGGPHRGRHLAQPARQSFDGRKVHGDIRFGAAFGFIVEDPIASLAPSFGLDLRDVAPGELRLGRADQPADLRPRLQSRAR
jgi:hypothetical protein